MKISKVVGIDIGGSHITAAIVDLEYRVLVPGTLVRNRIDSHAPADSIIAEWANTISDVSDKENGMPKKLGLALPGPFDYEEGISFIKGLDKYESLYGLNVKQLVAESLEIEAGDIRMMNDASCFLQGEVFGGAATGCNHVIGITLGTGLGSARIHNNTVYDGDLYYTPFKEGTAEDYLSSRWFVKRYKELTGNHITDVKDLKALVGKDVYAKRVFDEFGINLGEVLATYVNKHCAETVVIGGNIINAWDLFFPETRAILSLLPQKVEVEKAQLGEESALLGAASLWY